MAYVNASDYASEAIEERDPSYELPEGAADEEASHEVMSPADSAWWEAMVRRRPMLAELRTIEHTLAERGRVERN